jgi:small ligand-binding sensory domain FIST
MQWSSTVSEQFSLGEAVREAAAAIKAALGSEPPDLAIVFPSAHHSPDYEEVPRLVRDALRPRVLVGCSGGGVIGGGREVEDRIGLSLTAARMPGVEIAPFHVEDSRMPDPDAGPGAWERLLGVSASQAPQIVVLADPFSARADGLIAGLDYAFPGCAKIGGLASGGNEPGANALFLNEAAHRAGAVGVALTGDVRLDTVVAQGCRPIGAPAVVTKCHQNVLLELDNKKPMEVLRAAFEASNDRDRHLINTALHLGIVTDPLIEQLKPGDFLIRNVLGIHRESGGLVIGELLHEGQAVQFHVRDAQTAAEDLQALLRRYAGAHPPAAGQGALLFSCLGRGKHLFGRADHDTAIFQSLVGPLPLGGFFCNGEIGPVGATTFLHGFTSSFGIFGPRTP